MTEKGSLFNVAGFITCPVLFVVAARLMVKSGYGRDEGIYMGRFWDTALWVVIGSCAVGFLIFCFLEKYSHFKKARIISLVVWVVLLCSSILILSGWNYVFEDASSDVIESSNIRSVSMREVKELLQFNENGILYVGRKSCSACEQIVPDLVNLIENRNVDILYYSTEFDRNCAPDALHTLMEQLGVISIPSVLIIAEGEITHLFSGDDVVPQLALYLP